MNRPSDIIHQMSMVGRASFGVFTVTRFERISDDIDVPSGVLDIGREFKYNMVYRDGVSGGLTQLTDVTLPYYLRPIGVTNLRYALPVGSKWWGGIEGLRPIAVFIEQPYLEACAPNRAPE